MTDIERRLTALSDEKFKKFSQSLLPDVENILGVRLPVLQKIAMQEAKSDWKGFLNALSGNTFEERMLYGMTLGYAPVPFVETLPYIEKFLPEIDNWSVCDSFCCRLKSIRKSPEEGWNLIRSLLHDEREFYKRTALVLMLGHFVDKKHLNDVLNAAGSFNDDRHYVYMAQGWLLSVCAVKFPRNTYDFLKTARLSPQAFKQTLQKIRDSRRLSFEQKRRFCLLGKYQAKM